MILKLSNADFSANNVGKVLLPTPISDFVNQAIIISGRPMNLEQKISFQRFYESLTLNNLWGKITKLYIPFIGVDVTKAFVNYKNNNIDCIPTESESKLINGGFKLKNDTQVNIPVPLNIKANGVTTDLNNFSCFMLNTEKFDLSSDSIQSFGLTYTNLINAQNGINVSVEYSKGVIGFNTGVLSNNVYKVITPVSGFYTFSPINNKQVVGFSSNSTTINAVFKGSTNTKTPRNMEYVTQNIGTQSFIGNIQGNSYPRTLATGAIVIGEYMDIAEMHIIQDELEKFACEFIEM